MKQEHRGELMNPRVRSMRPLIWNGDQANLRRKRRGALPKRRYDDTIDAIAPCIPLRQLGLVQPIRELLLVQLPACQPPELAQRRLDRLQHVARQHSPQIRAHERIVVILIAQPGRGLDEDGHAGSPEFWDWESELRSKRESGEGRKQSAKKRT